MPSKAHDWLADYLRAARRDHDGPAPLEQERAQAEQNAALVSAPPGVVAEAVVALPGSLLLIPPGPREDLVLVFVHGGGFRIGTPGSLRVAAGILALRTGARVLCPKYRLAPEFPYPAGLDDCEDAYLYARDLAPRARVVICGESAGAGLAAALLLRRRDAGDERVLAGLLFSGVFDLHPARWEEGSWVDNAATDLVLAAGLGSVMTADYSGRADPAEPGISPLRADQTGLPPLLIHVSSAEMLLDDSLRLAAKAGRAGVETTLEIWPGMHHSWPVFAGLLSEGVEALERSAAFVRRAADGHVVDGPALADDPEILKLLP